MRSGQGQLLCSVQTDLTGSPEPAEGGKEYDTYQVGDIVSRRCFCSAQGLIKDETCTERSGSFRPVRLCTA